MNPLHQSFFSIACSLLAITFSILTIRNTRKLRKILDERERRRNLG